MNSLLKSIVGGLGATIAIGAFAQEASVTTNSEQHNPGVASDASSELSLGSAVASDAPAASEGAAERTSSSDSPVEAAFSSQSSIKIPKDTPVHLMVLNEVSTKEHGVGHRFKLRVNKPVKIDNVVAIPVGAIGWGEITNAERSGNLGKSGKLQARLLYVEVGGTNIEISGDTADKGNSGTGETIIGVIGLGVFGLFAKGNNAKLKAGEMMTAFTVEDTLLADSDPE